MSRKDFPSMAVCIVLFAGVIFAAGTYANLLLAFIAGSGQ